MILRDSFLKYLYYEAYIHNYRYYNGGILPDEVLIKLEFDGRNEKKNSENFEKFLSNIHNIMVERLNEAREYEHNNKLIDNDVTKLIKDVVDVANMRFYILHPNKKDVGLGAETSGDNIKKATEDMKKLVGNL